MRALRFNGSKTCSVNAPSHVAIGAVGFSPRCTCLHCGKQTDFDDKEYTNRHDVEMALGFFIEFHKNCREPLKPAVMKTRAMSNPITFIRLVKDES